MAFFVFNWTKREYILTVLALVMLVITVKHREKAISTYEKFGIWLGFVEEPKPCPEQEDLYNMAVEMGVSSVAILACTAISKMWYWSTSLFGRLTQTMKGGFQYLIDRVPFKKATTDTCRVTSSNYKYFFFRNANEQRKIIMVMREGDLREEIFVFSPEKKKMECVLSYNKWCR
ncbi:uncharacterized protein LOC133190643 [Saccostrea echinata]|uniref:uncharacterized protein LOC133190643 n=1 Tax=Saccostrea echinata TaxID=191078 RepID=UPI002A819366|nr:uncharacterized protein LOC133190643 [Saccostrea echinata]